MEEQTPQPAPPSAVFTSFLAAVKKNGVYVEILINDENGDKKIERWDLKKGATEHKVTDDNLLGFRPHTRKEQRALFHTPYKFGRRIKP